ncbi:DNA gyrase subunit A [Collinsella intestinalis]|nr:DNA gyrase subunit A [Collinsella intestinalis]
MTDRKGALAAMKVVGPQHELLIITEGATVLRVKTAEISQTGRATQGVKMMSVDDGDRVTAVARMTSAKKKAKDSAEGEEPVEGEDPAEAEGQEPTDLPDGVASQVPGDEDHVDIDSANEALEDPLEE